MRKKADPVARTPSGTPVSVDLGAESVPKILVAFPPTPLSARITQRDTTKTNGTLRDCSCAKRTETQ
eukprot:6527449-Pyramimonas_sp.AAC.1